MADLSKLSDEELERIAATPTPKAKGVAELSDEELEAIANNEVGVLESIGRGAAQGMSAGFIDELSAAVGAALDSATSPVDYGIAYEGRKRAIRRRDDVAEEQNPGIFNTALVGGSVLGAFAPGVSALNAGKTANVAGGLIGQNTGKLGAAFVRNMGKEGVGRAAISGAQGAVAGAGFSEAETAGDLLNDVATGGLLGIGTQVGLDKALSAGKTIAKKAGSVFGGVKEENIAKYLADPDSVRNAPSLEDIKDLADAEVGKMRLEVDALKGERAEAVVKKDKLEKALSTAFEKTRSNIKEKVTEAKETLKLAWQQKTEALQKSGQVPLELAEEMVGRVNAQKAVLGALSEQAEDALAATGGTVNKAHLLELVDQIGGSVGVGKGKALIGEEAEAAVQSFYKTRQKIADGLPDKIPYTDLRGVMRQLRADIANSGGFSGKAGEFNSTLTSMRKELTRSVSDFLKKSDGGYAATMEAMAPKASVLEEVSGYFGDPAQALSSLQTIVNDSGPRATYLKDLLTRFADETGNADLMQKLAALEQSRATLGSPSAMAALKESMPEFRDVRRATEALEQYSPKRTARGTELLLETAPVTDQIKALDVKLGALQEQNKRFAGWSPMSTQNRLTSAMGGRNIENVRALEELSTRSGLNFIKMIEDRRVADAFDKGFMHGSRNVNLWSLVGRVFGGGAMLGDAGALLGASMGANIDSMGPRMTRKALDAFLSIKGSRFGQMLEAASDQGFGAMASTHLMLSQRDSEYAAMIDAIQRDAENPQASAAPKSFDPAVVAKERARLQRDDNMPSTERAKALTNINKNGYVELPEPDFEEIADELPPHVDIDDLLNALEAVQ